MCMRQSLRNSYNQLSKFIRKSLQLPRVAVRLRKPPQHHSNPRLLTSKREDEQTGGNRPKRRTAEEKNQQEKNNQYKKRTRQKNSLFAIFQIPQHMGRTRNKITNAEETVAWKKCENGFQGNRNAIKTKNIQDRAEGNFLKKYSTWATRT